MFQWWVGFEDQSVKHTSDHSQETSKISLLYSENFLPEAVFESSQMCFLSAEVSLRSRFIALKVFEYADETARCLFIFLNNNI